MKFRYCPHCGARLIPRPIGDEGLVPYCEVCRVPLFDMFSTCVIILVTNEYGEAALLRQGYISGQYYNLVSGYMKPGETAEEAAAREVQEELGLPLLSLRFAGTYWFGKKDMLMVGFIGTAKKQGFALSGEVDAAQWFPIRECPGLVHPKGSVSYALVEKYLEEMSNR